MKYCIQILVATILLICVACTPGEQDPSQAGFVLPIERSLSADGLSAEIGIYTASTTPQIEGSIQTISLRESGGKLFADIDVEAQPGQKLVRIYLSHTQAGALLWVGEWPPYLWHAPEAQTALLIYLFLFSFFIVTDF